MSWGLERISCLEMSFTKNGRDLTTASCVNDVQINSRPYYCSDKEELHARVVKTFIRVLGGCDVHVGARSLGFRGLVGDTVCGLVCATTSHGTPKYTHLTRFTRVTHAKFSRVRVAQVSRDRNVCLTLLGWNTKCGSENNGTHHRTEGGNACHQSVGVSILGQRAKPRQSICLFFRFLPPAHDQGSDGVLKRQHSAASFKKGTRHCIVVHRTRTPEGRWSGTWCERVVLSVSSLKKVSIHLACHVPHVAWSTSHRTCTESFHCSLTAISFNWDINHCPANRVTAWPIRRTSPSYIFLVCRGRKLSSRHLGCRCCTAFTQFSTGIVIINAMLPRRHCLKALKNRTQEQKHPQHSLRARPSTRQRRPDLCYRSPEEDVKLEKLTTSSGHGAELPFRSGAFCASTPSAVELRKSIWICGAAAQEGQHPCVGGFVCYACLGPNNNEVQLLTCPPHEAVRLLCKPDHANFHDDRA